jgi:chemotaxis protein methyltransferase CheR
MNNNSATGHSLSHDELEELLGIVLNVHGYDFGSYSKASLKRRILHVLTKYKLTPFELKQRLLNEESFFQTFLNEVTVNVTEMFRDPSFYRSVRTHVFPYLATYSHIKIWNAGCSSGEETYSFAIMLKEEGLYQKSFLYGTDINSNVLQKATDGIYDLKNIKGYSENYLQAGGRGSLSDHYHAAYDACIFDGSLKKNMLFSVHNMVMDNVFNEFQLVVCRNVLIYFDTDLQEKVINLLHDSLCTLGFLCLGSKETIRNSALKQKFKVIDPRENIYQKLG